MESNKHKSHPALSPMSHTHTVRHVCMHTHGYILMIQENGTFGGMIMGGLGGRGDVDVDEERMKSFQIMMLLRYGDVG